MIYNDEELNNIEVEAVYIINKHSRDTYIEIKSNDKIITLNFNDSFNPKKLELNKKVNLIDYINWDVELKTKETYYLFDISKDKVFLTRTRDNKYKIEINIEKPDMIYSPLGNNATFDNLIINMYFSFKYE